MIDDQTALRTAIDLLRDASKSGRKPSGQPLEPGAAALHERAAAHLEALLHRQSEAGLQDLIDAMPIHVWTSRADGSDVFFNRRRLEYTGPDVDWFSIIHPDERAERDAAWDVAVRTGRPFQFEQRLVAADGSHRWFLGRAEPLRDREGRVVRWVGVNIDIEERRQAEERLRRAEDDLRAIIDTIPTHVWTTGADGSDSYLNRRRLDYSGRDADLAHVVHPDDRAQQQQAWLASVRTGEFYQNEQRLLGADGSYRWFLSRAEPVLNASGDIVKWVGIDTDIDDLKRAQERLERAERAVRIAFDAIPVLAWRARPDGSTEFVNKRFLDYTGLELADALDRAWCAAVHPDDVVALMQTWQQHLADSQPIEAEARLRRFDGVYRWFLFRANPLLDSSGAVECWYGTNIDIEDRKRAEQVQADAERQLKSVIDTIPAHVWRAGPDGENDFINQTRAEFGGGNLSWQDLAHPDDAVVHRELWEEAQQTGEPFEQEMRLLGTNGAYRWFLVRVAPQRDDDGTIRRWFGTNTDIEDLKQAQEHVRRSEQDLRAAIDTIPTHVWSALPDGSDIYLNRRQLDYAGESVGFEAIVHPDDRAEHNKTWAAAVRTGEPWEVECRLRRADGSYRWFLVRAEPLRDDGGRIVRWFGINTDINDLRIAQQQLRLAEGELRATIDTIPAHIWSCLPDGTSDYFNRRRVEYTGPDVGFFGIVHPDDRVDHDEKWATSIRTGRPFEVENRLRRFDGAYRRFLGRAEPVRDEQGNITKWFGTNTDIEDLRVTEEALQRAQAELAHVSRVSTLGELTASIAHEVNQPLAGIVTNGEACLRWLRRERPNLEEAQLAVERIISDGKRAAQVVNRLRALVRKEDSDRRPLNLNELVEESLPLVAQEMSRQRIKVELSLAPGLPLVMADRVQLQQVLINLLINAIQAMTEAAGQDRVLTIASRVEQADAVMLAVRDSGPGIDPAAARHLFKAFFTTKTNGMGMGLSICRSIVEAHGGRIWASGDAASDATRGAVFQFTLPVPPDETGTAPLAS
ncbi:MAG: PAS domain-containing protein [Acetobacteraceae bacterium]